MKVNPVYYTKEAVTVSKEDGEPYFCEKCFKTNCFKPVGQDKYSCVCCEEVVEIKS